jgi:DNA-binding MarR family transcriptional regulator
MPADAWDIAINTDEHIHGTMADYRRSGEMHAPSVMKKYMDAYISDALEGTGIPSSYGPFIIELDIDRGMSQKELTERVYVHKSLTTRVVKELISMGFAENRSTEKEYSLYLTERGDEAKKTILENLDNAICFLMSDMTDEEKSEFRRLMRKIESTARSYRKPE